MTIGPFSFAPGVVLALLAVCAALGVGNAVAGRAGARAEGLLWYCALAALLAGRGVFVARWWPAYAEAPLQVFNLRDGGFHALAAGVAALVAGALLAWRRPLQRRPLLAGLAAAFIVWGGGTAWWASREDTPALPALTLAAPDGRTVDLARLAGRLS
jgi:prolipoprotein diacylglyceryltransferase